MPNDSASDQSAFDCAVSLIPSGGRAAIYIPAGTFNLTALVGIMDKHVAFRGEGQKVTKLRLEPRRWHQLHLDDGSELYAGSPLAEPDQKRHERRHGHPRRLGSGR